MLVTLIMAIWFGIAAKRSGRNVVLWAIGGAALAFVVGLIVGALARGIVGRVHIDDYPTYLIVTGAVSIGLTILIGTLVTSRLSGAPPEQLASATRARKALRVAGPTALLGQIKEPYILLRSVAWTVLWVVPACFLLNFIADRFYSSLIYDTDLHWLGLRESLFGALAFFSGLLLMILLRGVRHPVVVTSLWMVSFAVLSTGVSYLVFRQYYGIEGYRFLERGVFNCVWAACFLGLMLGLVRLFSIRWWVFLGVGFTSSVLTNVTSRLANGSGSVDVMRLLQASEFGVMEGLALYLAFYLVARMGFDWSKPEVALSTGERSEPGVSATPSREVSPSRPTAAALQTLLLACLVLAYVFGLKAAGYRNGGIWDIIVPPLVWVIAMLRVGIVHSVLAGALGVGSLYLFVRFATKTIRREFGRDSIEISIIVWLVVYAAILALWAYAAQKTRESRHRSA